MDEPTQTSKEDEFRELTPEERRAVIEKARRELPELERQIERSKMRLRRIAAGEFPTKPPRPIR